LTEARLVKARGRGEHYVRRLGIFLGAAREWLPGGTLFVGDSITEGFPLAEAFPDGHVINQGIGGDKINGVRERLDIVALAQPATVYLMIGTNDVAWKETVTSETLRLDYASLLDELRQVLPEARIIVQSVLPTGRAYAGGNARVQQLNGVIAELAQERKLEFVNLYPKLQGADGLMDSQYTTDGIHLSLAGYWRWLREIRTDEELLANARGLAPRWARTRGFSRTANKVDPALGTSFGGDRGTNELVVYTPAYGAEKTGTNPWGTESIIRNGIVTSGSPGNSIIPDDGFVVSGHGDAAQWVAMNLKPGVHVALADGVVSVAPAEAMTTTVRIDHVERLVITRMATAPDDPALAAAFLELQALRRATTVESEVTAALEKIEQGLR
jgi:lysophospholipase L1-like esterase